jgi:hypothetical protein
MAKLACARAAYGHVSYDRIAIKPSEQRTHNSHTLPPKTGVFRPDRLAQLRMIKDQGGSLQSIDCLHYDEYKKIIQFYKEEPLFTPFIQAHDRLGVKLKEFAHFNPFIKYLKMDKLKKQLEKEAAQMPMHRMITESFGDDHRPAGLCGLG